MKMLLVAAAILTIALVAFGQDGPNPEVMAAELKLLRKDNADKAAQIKELKAEVQRLNALLAQAGINTKISRPDTPQTPNLDTKYQVDPELLIKELQKIWSGLGDYKTKTTIQQDDQHKEFDKKCETYINKKIKWRVMVKDVSVVQDGKIVVSVSIAKHEAVRYLLTDLAKTEAGNITRGEMTLVADIKAAVGDFNYHRESSNTILIINLPESSYQASIILQNIKFEK